MSQNKISIGLSNPKSPENVDAIMRLAGNFSVDAVNYTGSRYPRALALNPDTPNISRQISKNVALKNVQCLIQSAPRNCKIVCVEFAENAIALPEFQHPENACYIFGPEDGSVTQEILNHCAQVIYVPTQGCMNLSQTVSVVLYDRMAKSFQAIDDNEMIRKNKDKNNNLKAR